MPRHSQGYLEEGSSCERGSKLFVGGLTDAELYSLLAFKAQGMIWVDKSIMSYDGLERVTIFFVLQDLIPVMSKCHQDDIQVARMSPTHHSNQMSVYL